jgi:serine/threonine protein kinase
MELREGFIFHDHYRLIKQLGVGGFSEVWLAEDIKTDLRVALKVYAPGSGLDKDGVQLFAQEFTLVFNLNHGNLLTPKHYDIYEQRPYLVMPFCENGSATKLVGTIDNEKAWRLLRDVASGLAYLHDREPTVIHQDIKPDNILINTEGDFLITDFGISTKARSTLRKSVAQHQSSGGGTLAYMSPERFGRNPAPVMASDVWALGATMYELMTGDTPFGNLGGTFQKSGAEIPDIPGNYSPDLKKIVKLCLNEKPWDRPSAKQIAEWAKQEKISGKGTGKKTWIIAVAAVIVVAAVCGGIFLLPPKSVPPGSQNESVQETEVKAKIFDIDGNRFTYTGEVKNGYPNGKGSAKYEHDERDEKKRKGEYTGNFVDGRRSGAGKMIYYDSNNQEDGRYEGRFSNDMRHGRGQYTYRSKNYLMGEWQNGKIIEKSEVEFYKNETGETILGTYEKGEIVPK